MREIEVELYNINYIKYIRTWILHLTLFISFYQVSLIFLMRVERFKLIQNYK